MDPHQGQQRTSSRTNVARASAATSSNANNSKRKRGGNAGRETKVGNKKRNAGPPIGTHDIAISPESITIQRHDSFQEGLVPFGSFGIAGEGPSYTALPLSGASLHTNQQRSPEYPGSGMNVSGVGSRGSFDSTYTPLFHMNSLNSQNGYINGGTTDISNNDAIGYGSSTNNNVFNTANTTTNFTAFDGQPLAAMSSIDKREFVNLMTSSPRSANHGPDENNSGNSSNTDIHGSQHKDYHQEHGYHRHADTSTANGKQHDSSRTDSDIHRRMRSLEARNLTLESKFRDLYSKHEALLGILCSYLHSIGTYKGTPRSTPRGSQGGLSKENSIEKATSSSDKESKDEISDMNLPTGRGNKLDLDTKRDKSRSGSIDVGPSHHQGTHHNHNEGHQIPTSTPVPLQSALNGQALQRVATLDPHMILTSSSDNPPNKPPQPPPLTRAHKSTQGHHNVHNHTGMSKSNHDAIALNNNRSIAENALKMLRESREERSPGKCAILAATALRNLIPIPHHSAAGVPGAGVYALGRRPRAGSDVLNAMDDATADARDAAELMISIASQQQILAGQSIVKQQSLPASYKPSGGK